eukprot:5537811-Pleurochrysis_carterae.AAC.1
MFDAYSPQEETTGSGWYSPVLTADVALDQKNRIWLNHALWPPHTSPTTSVARSVVPEDIPTYAPLASTSSAPAAGVKQAGSSGAMEVNA